jgi:hypothetical protein
MNAHGQNFVSTVVILVALILPGAACSTAPSPQPGSSAATPVSPPQPQTPFPIKGTIKPGDKLGAMSIEREESKHYYWLLDSCNFDWEVLKPTSQTVQCTVPPLPVVAIGAFWGATAAKIESSWKLMSWELSVDDYQVALDEFGWSDFSIVNSGEQATYRNWNVLLRNLSPGRHTIRSSWTMATPVDDGWNTYAPGRYDFIAALTVTERPDYPTIPQVAESGQHAYTSKDAGLDFLLYVPKAYGEDPKAEWPLILYLHDAEWRGTNPDFVRRDSLPRRLDIQGDIPFLVISPAGNGDWDFWSKEGMIVPVLRILEEVQTTYAVDPKRIYLTGAGMGGNGVWALGLLHPDAFAALVPLDGYLYPFGVPDNICDLKDVPVWAFHGENDFMVPVEVEQDLVSALNACGGKAQITIKTDAVIPMDEYYRPELYEWLLSQSMK